MSSLFRRYALVACVAAYAAVLVFLHGAGRFPRPGLYDFSRLIGAPSLTLEGRVADFPVTRWNQTRFLFEAEAVPLNAFRGRAAVTLAFPRPDLGPGDRLRLSGWLSAPRPASALRPFDERRYWEGFGVFALFKVWSVDRCQRLDPASPWAWRSLAWAFQKRFQRYWEKALPPEEAGLLLGITIGGRGRLSAPLKNACIRAGVYHIMVVSGQNVMFILSFGIVALRLLRIPKRHALWIGAAPLIFYATLVGAEPPVVRASAMALVGLAVAALRRDVPRIYPFSLAAGAILMADPEALFGASFQLSFGATASLMALSPLLERAGRVRPVGLAWFAQAGAVCLAVYIGIWPLLLYYFHRLSLIGLAANVVLFPLSGLLMAMGLAIGTVGMWVPAAVPPILIRLTGLFTQGALRGIFWFSQPSWAAVASPPPGPLACGMYYGFLFGILFLLDRRKIHAEKNLTVSTNRPGF